MTGRAGDRELFFRFSSFTHPPVVYRHDVGRKAAVPFFFISDTRGPAALPRRAPGDHVVTQVWYRAKDGTKISMFLVHRRDMERDGERPVYLTGYGGFNISMTPQYRPGALPLARARRRGGGAQPARRRRVRRRVAPGGDVRPQADGVRRLHRRRGVADRGEVHRAAPHRHRGRQQRRAAGRRRDGAAPGSVRRRRLPGAGGGHAALSPVHGRPVLGLASTAAPTIPGSFRTSAPTRRCTTSPTARRIRRR